jgi:hypothetical protein
MAINLNNTTPVAPAGSTNVTWQKDTSGNVSAYVTVAPELTGDNVDLTAQAANISVTTIVATPAPGLYRVSGYISVSQVATSSSTLPSIVLTWTDQNSGQAMSLTLTPTNSGNLLTTVQENNAILSVNSSTDIQFSTTGYASSGATPMQYSIHMRVEAL